MAKGKTPYTINFQADPNIVNGMVQSWLSANGFRLITEEGIQVYCSGNGAVSAKRYFEYSISGSQLNILAYLQSVKKPFALDSGLVGAMNTTPYISLIRELTSAIDNLSAQSARPQQNIYNAQQVQYSAQTHYAAQPQYNAQDQYATQSQYAAQQQFDAQPQYNAQTQYSAQPTSNSSFHATADKRTSNCAIIALVLGIINIFLALIGMSFGVIVIIVAYALAVQGMKSSKKNLAIAGIITTSFSLVIIVLALIGALPWLAG